jgi:phosphoserine phosphatase RsbU/P
MSDLIEELQDLYENAPCGYLTLQDGIIVKANKTFADWLGYRVTELVGRRFHEFLSIAGRIYYETHIGPLLRMQGFISEVALDLETSSGERVATIANADERRDEAGKPLFVRLILIKAAERRRYERNLVDSLKDERSTAELREQFIAVLGHDLRNPLASISSGIRLLEREPDNSPKQTQILTMMQNTVIRMAGLIDNVLDFARGRLGGGITLSRDANQPLEQVLNQVIDELETDVRSIARHFSILQPVNCDRSRIGEMVSNLVGNAITHGSADKPVRVYASTQDGVFELAVANEGEPIAEATRDRLFQPFFRGEIRKSQQGLGLGLYIASEIAKAHGGTLTVESSIDETRFIFRMPLQPPEQNQG